MQGHSEKCVERYCELAHFHPDKLKTVSTPCIDDHAIPADEHEAKVTLAAVCARIVLKVLFNRSAHSAGPNRRNEAMGNRLCAAG